MDGSTEVQISPVPLKRPGALPPAPVAPPEEGRLGVEPNEEIFQVVTTQRSSESEDFLRTLPDRPDDEYDDEPGRARLAASLRELLEDESESSQGPGHEEVRLPPPPEQLQVNEQFALAEFEEEVELDVSTQLHLEDGDQPPAAPPEDVDSALPELPRQRTASRGSLGSALKARAKAFARGRSTTNDGASKGKKKKKKSQAFSPPSLQRDSSRLSEMSSASFIFDDEEMSSESNLQRSVRCFHCRLQCSLSCISCQVYLVAIGFALALAVYAGMQSPELHLGAFDLWSQVQVPGSLEGPYFAWARRSALALRHARPLGPVNESAARQWHTIELFWEMGPSEEQREQDFQPQVISDAYMSRVHSAEAELQGLPDWAALCNASVAEVQFLCSPGDSLAALAFGTWEAPAFLEQIQGMKWKVWFDGKGRGTQIPVETLLAFAQEVEPSLLERWLSQGSAGSEDERRILRSTFMFYLPREEATAFQRFVDDAVRPYLEQLQDDSEQGQGGLRAFYRIDGRDLNDLTRYFQHQELSICTPIIALVAVQLATRRALLALGAGAAVAAAEAALGSQAPASILAWPYLAVSTAEIAIACSSIISYNRVLMRPEAIPRKGLQAALHWRSPWRESWLAWLQMPLQLFAPTLAAAAFLQAVRSLAIDVPMVQEFADPALLGTLTILVLGPLIFVPAVLVGDALAERRLFDASGLALLLPKEVASSPSTAAQRRTRRRYALFVVARYDNWFACPTLTVAALILVVIVVANSQVLLEAETPYLFSSGHIFHTAEEVKAQGGLPSPSVMAATALQNASSCQIGAEDSLRCSWYSCTAETAVAGLTSDLCECDYRLRTPLGTCVAVSRFAGLDVPVEGFWAWANATIGTRLSSLAISDFGAATWSAVAPLELEDWNSGQNLLQKQMASRLPGVAATECFEAQCYCGQDRCNMAPGIWQPLGRLNVSDSTAGSGLAASGIGNLTASMEVAVVWGDKVGPALDLANLQAQRDLLAFCVGTSPELEILSRSCWAIDFKSWLQARGRRYPVPPEHFWELLEQFAIQEGMEKYFWYQNGVGLVGTFAAFAVPSVSAADAAAVRHRWESYLSLRTGSLPVRPWLAVPEPFQVDPTARLQELGRSLALLAVPVLGAAMCLFSCSLALGLAAAAAAGLSITLLIACAPLGPQEGVLQLLCLVIFAVGAVAPITRFLLFYSSARNGPGKRVKSQVSDVFDLQVPEIRAPSQPQESIARSERNRFKSMASSEDQHLQELQRRWSQVTADRKEMQSTFRRAAIAGERRNRSMTALRHSAEILLGYAVSAPLCWLLMFLVAPASLGQVARVFLLMACVLPAVTLCGLPIFILGGLGQSRVWRQALVAFVWATTGLARHFGGPSCSDPELRSPKDDEEEVRRASKVLGWPFTRLGQCWLQRRGAKLSMGPTEVTPSHEL